MDYSHTQIDPHRVQHRVKTQIIATELSPVLNDHLAIRDFLSS